MTCEKAFDRYLNLDKNERVPLPVTIHLIVCPVCRTGVRLMTRSEKILSKPLTRETRFCSGDPVIAAALARISESGLAYKVPEVEEHQVSLFRWFISGIALIAGFAIVPLSSIGVWSSLAYGTSFLVPLYLLCGFAITAYCGMFVGSNIDFFVKKFGMEHTI